MGKRSGNVFRGGCGEEKEEEDVVVVLEEEEGRWRENGYESKAVPKL